MKLFEHDLSGVIRIELGEEHVLSRSGRRRRPADELVPMLRVFTRESGRGWTRAAFIVIGEGEADRGALLVELGRLVSVQDAERAERRAELAAARSAAEAAHPAGKAAEA